MVIRTLPFQAPIKFMQIDGQPKVTLVVAALCFSRYDMVRFCDMRNLQLRVRVEIQRYL